MAPVAGDAAETLRDVRFRAVSGCADYPEAELDATGTPSRGSTSYGSVGGLLEGHMHWMTYQFLGGRFHCGRPWDAYGIPYALPDCSSIEGPQGLAAPIQNFLNYDNPLQPHDTAGYPTLASWKPTNLTYEGTYWKWVQRAWMAGLRMMVMSPNENRILCLLQTNRDTNCDEMDTVRRSLQAIHQLQDYVDAQSGGPGRGFFQIVTDPRGRAARDQPGQDGGAAGGRGVRAVRLRGDRRALDVRHGQGRCGAGRVVLAWACGRCCC